MIRQYTQSDRDACLSIFDSNCPRYFDRSERREFEGFLTNLSKTSRYLVIEREGCVIACGGLSINATSGRASLSWGMVENKLRKTGIGTRLTGARIAEAKTDKRVTELVMDTSQHSVSFYERFGFSVMSIVKDGYGEGLDRYELVLPLN